MTTEETSIANIEPAASQSDTNTIDGEAKVISSESEPEGEAKPEAKTEKTPEQREIDRLRRGIDRRTRQLSEARAQLDLTRSNNNVAYQQTSDDSEPLSLTRAQIQEMVTAEAHKLAPTLRNQEAETERRQSVVQSLATTWGQERFNEVSSELDDVFGGLTDASGRPKPAIEAVFESKSPAQVIEWLTDPDNIDEAERIAKLSPVQAGIAIAKLEARIDATPKQLQKVSKAPAPLEAIKGKGPKSNDLNDDLSSDEWLARRNKQLRDRY